MYLFLFHGLLLGGVRRLVGVRRLDWGLSFLGVCRLVLGEEQGGDLLRDLTWKISKYIDSLLHAFLITNGEK